MGQFCYMNPKYNTVIAFFSSSRPWEAAVEAGETFDAIFEDDRRLEIETWHACHEISKRLA